MTDNMKMRVLDKVYLIAALVIVGFLSAVFSAKGENQRILTKCLEHNSTMPYAEAAEECKGMVR